VVHESAVTRVIIHLDQLTPPAAFTEYSPLVVPIYNHLQTALVLVLDGTLGGEAVRVVTREMLDQFGLDRDKLTLSAEDIFRRRRPFVAPEAMHALALKLFELTAPGAPDDAVTETLREIAEHAEHVATRPVSLVAPPMGGRKPLDYVELFDREEARRAETRKQKKSPAKNDVPEPA